MLGEVDSPILLRDLARKVGQDHLSLLDTLRRLHGRGLVRVTWRLPKTAFGGYPQREFTLTPEGREVARQFVTD